jgi:hypothetical protein
VGRCVLSRSQDQQLEAKNFGRENHSTRGNLPTQDGRTTVYESRKRLASREGMGMPTHGVLAPQELVTGQSSRQYQMELGG